jgi:hypothetical protein
LATARDAFKVVAREAAKSFLMYLVISFGGPVVAVTAVVIRCW